MTIFEIDSKILKCIDQETGEVIDEQALNELEMTRDAKIENVACWIKELKAEAEAIKVEKLKLAERQKVAENKAESLKKWLAFVLDGQKVSYPRASISFRSSKAVEITNIDALIKCNEKLVTYEPKADKTAIKLLLEAGEKLEGVALVSNTSVQIK